MSARDAQAKKKWTFMVYLAGDNNLSAAGERDLAEMRAVGSTDTVNVVAEFDNAGQQGTRRFHIRPDGGGEPVQTLGETDSGSPAVLLDFIRWARNNYEAERYALILWNHGGGWEPGEVERIAARVNAPEFLLRGAQERQGGRLGSIFFRTTLEKILSLPGADERAIASDDGSGHSLDTLELGRVLVEAKEILGQKVDLLGMDACLMANLEVAYESHPAVKVIVASVENEPDAGWPYDRILEKLVAAPEMDAATLAGHIVQDYFDYYDGYWGNVAQSALDLAQMAALLQPLARLATAVSDHLPDARREIGASLYATPARFWEGTLWDLGNFCQVLAGTTAEAAIARAAQEVLAALEPGPRHFVLARRQRGPKLEQSRGLSIYLPPRILHGVSRYYGELAFAREHPWAAMLNAYHDADG